MIFYVLTCDFSYPLHTSFCWSFSSSLLLLSPLPILRLTWVDAWAFSTLILSQCGSQSISQPVHSKQSCSTLLVVMRGLWTARPCWGVNNMRLWSNNPDGGRVALLHASLVVACSKSRVLLSPGVQWTFWLKVGNTESSLQWVIFQVMMVKVSGWRIRNLTTGMWVPAEKRLALSTCALNWGETTAGQNPYLAFALYHWDIVMKDPSQLF